MGLNRRELLAASVAGQVPAARVARGGAAPSNRPHILLLMTDQHRADCLGADGNRVIRTPNLDRLANEGVRFRRGYSSMPTCTPARSALLTGLSPWNHGMLRMIRMAERYPIEKPRVLREAGYYTLGIGKMHYHPQRNPHGFHRVILDESGREESPEYRSDYRAWFWSQAPGLDPDATGIGWNDYRAKPYALPEALHPTRWTGDTAVNFLNQYQGPEPFFLKVSFARPHSPYDPPERWMRHYADAGLPKAFVGKWAQRYAPRSDSSNNIWHGAMGEEQIRHSRQGYYGSVSFVDEQIGRILEALEKRRWLEQTLIVFISDHGDMTGDHNLWRKSYPYESSARVPFLMRWPEGLVSAERGQVIHRPVELRDVLPTFMDAASLPPREELDGRSLLALLRGGGAGWREFLDLEHGTCYSPKNRWNALTDGRWKYIFHSYDGEEQLFDLDADPHEVNDLASSAGHGAELARWRQRMVNHLAIRGETHVKNGRLVPRPDDPAFSPNFPGCSCHPTAKA